MDKLKSVMPLKPPVAVKIKPDLKSQQVKQAEQAAKQFETMLALQMVRSMQSSLEGGNMFGPSQAGDVYNGMAEWELAKALTDHAHLGIREQILRQLPKTEDNKK
jgi:Rod binding domain-containing protein